MSTIKQFITDFQGKKIFEQYSFTQQLSISVQIKGDANSKRTLQVPNNASILYLKLLINDSFKLNNDDFAMTLTQINHLITKENEEDFTVKSIDNINKQTEGLPDVTIQVKANQKNEDYVQQQLFKEKPTQTQS